MSINSLASLVKRTKQFSAEVDALSFSAPTAYVYNPLAYAWEAHQQYLEKFAQPKKEMVFLGMNPGPWGMAQTGIPFGEISLVRDWMGISASVDKPVPEHPKRPIEGFACQKSEVSGRRLWGFFKEEYGTADLFFQKHFVANYCPLVFMEESARNRTPDKLPVAESSALFDLCDAYFRDLIQFLQPTWVIGVGAFAAQRAEQALAGLDIRISKILHPSPASPAANKGWAAQAKKQLAVISEQ